VAVKIRLKRMGKIRAPFYRVVVMDSRTKRDGRAIEEIGKYHPTAEPSVIDIDSARAQHWLTTGAQPTEAVEALLKVTGDWQKFKGLPGAEGTLKVAEPKRSKRDLYEAAVAAAGGSTLDVKDAPARKKAAPAAKKAAPAETAAAAETAPAPAAETAPAAPAAEAAVEATPAEATPAEAAPAADTDSGAASSESTDSSDDPGATTAAGDDAAADPSAQSGS
jgi:small subunit ribosomal protein S16